MTDEKLEQIFEILFAMGVNFFNLDINGEQSN